MFVAKSTGSPFLNLPRDTNFSNTVLLLHGDGVSGANNSMFIDNSGVETYIPFKDTSSYYFNGGTDYLSIPHNTALDLSTGAPNWTVEFWFNTTNSAVATGPIISKDWTSGSTNPSYSVYLVPNQITFNIGTGTGATSSALYSYTGVANNTWYHVAMVRNGSNMLSFVNGTLANTSAAITPALTDAGNPLRIGSNQNTSGYFPGYISNLRITKGVALYTSSFTIPSSELPYVNGTQLLTAQTPTSAQIPSTQQPSVFKDNSPNNLTFTITGTPAITTGSTALVPSNGKPGQGTFSPFSQPDGYWSNYFNGTNDYLSATVPAPGSDFTVEGWVNFSTVTSGVGTSPTPIAIIGSSSSTGFQVYGSALGWAVRNNTQNILGVGGSAGLGTPPAVGQWNHVAFVRNSGTVTLYVNGNSVGANSTAFTFSDTTFTIGNSLTGTSFFNGYVSNVRYVNGIALYTNNFTLYNTPLTAVANTQLLTCQSNRFIDNSSSNRTITSFGSPPSVQAFSPFITKTSYSKNRNSGSLSFYSPTNDQVQSGQFLQTFNPGANDFTMECWAYITASASRQDLIGFGANGTNNRFGLVYQTTGNLDYISGVGSPATSLISVSVTDVAFLNRWNHIALSRNSGTSRLYLNGALIGNTADTSTWTDPLKFTTGRDQYGSTNMTGYATDLRLINGTGLYPAAFTPPTAPLTAVGNTVLLVNGTNANIIDQTGKNSITSSGGVSISTTQSKFGGSSLNFNGTNGCLVMPSNQSIALSAGSDFTVECWLYTPTASLAPAVWQNTGTGKIIAFFLTDVGVTVLYSIIGEANYPAASNSAVLRGTTNIAINTWTHVAFVRSGSTITIYVNGIASGTATNTLGTNALQIVGAIAQGGAPNFYFFNGFIDELRVTRSARYTANFTPQTYRFADR